MKKTTLKIATRKSPLALWQAEHIRQQLLSLHPDLSIDLLPMTTSGDKFLKDKLLVAGGKGLFVKELEDALLDKRADLAVHSMKDVPAIIPDPLTIAAICKRDNPFDAFVSPNYANLMDLPKAAKMGTSSLRRQSQLLAIRPDLQMHTLRGNIQTRLQKMLDEPFDAIILAAAGLERMGMQSTIQQILSPDLMLPACGQGALGVECRKEDAEMLQLLQALNHDSTANCVWAERMVNALLGGNCHVPLAVYCQEIQQQCHIEAKILSMDGRQIIYDKRIGSLQDTASLAKQCAEELLKNGGLQLLEKHG